MVAGPSQTITVDVPTSVLALVTAIAAALAAVAAAAGVWDQYRRGRRTEGLDFLWRFLTTWESTDMQTRRIEVATELLSEPPRVSRLMIDILNFFDVLGYYVKAGSVPLEGAWSLFCVAAVYYRYACDAEIQRQRRNDPTTFEQLVYLADACLKLDQKKRKLSLEQARPTQEEWRYFLTQERALKDTIALPPIPPPAGGIPSEPLSPPPGG